MAIIACGILPAVRWRSQKNIYIVRFISAISPVPAPKMDGWAEG